MDGRSSGNLKRLLDAVPPGFIVDSAWLTEQGIGRRSAYDYVERGWLERLARGLFRRPIPGATQTEALDWKLCVLSLQHIMGYDAHVGGMTALALDGYAHYLPLGGNSVVHLFGQALPGWLATVPMNAQLVIKNTTLFSDALLGVSGDDGEVVPTPFAWQLRSSTIERAILEAIDELPNYETFHNVDVVFESLTTLRPHLLTELLQDCTSVKVKRLFFVFADRHRHAWRKRIDPSGFYLGRGDRALVKGGALHPDYRIVVPSQFVTRKTVDAS